VVVKANALLDTVLGISLDDDVVLDLFFVKKPQILDKRLDIKTFLPISKYESC